MTHENVGIKFNCEYEILTKEGYKDFDGIAKIPNKSELVRITLFSGESIDVTQNHTFTVNNIDVDVKDLIVGECLETSNGLEMISSIMILYNNDEKTVYDILDVKSSDNSYYANDINNHNCKFLGTSNTLIEGDILERILPKQPQIYKMGGLFGIYENPVPGVSYVLGVDTAKGTGRDSSVVQVLKITSEFNIKQVAIYKYNKIDTHNYAQVCIGISQFYNNAYLMIENNGEGGEVANTIWHEYEYEYLLNCDTHGLGIRSTKKSKLSANLLLKRYLENGWLTIYDSDTISELSKYIEVTPNVFKGESRTTHDDCVTSLLWGLYYLTTEFYDDKDASVKTIDSEYNIEDDSPFMFHS